jgi:hypothetical protein
MNSQTPRGPPGQELAQVHELAALLPEHTITLQVTPSGVKRVPARTPVRRLGPDAAGPWGTW